MKIITDPSHDGLVSVIKDAFKGEPWNEPDLKSSEITSRLDMFLPKQRVTLGVLVDPYAMAWSAPSEDTLVGVSWFGAPKPGALPNNVTHFLVDAFPGIPVVYYGATAVYQKWQGNKIAKRLKEAALHIADELYPGCVVVTRMRSDNHRMIAVNLSHGFARTGVVELSHGEGVYEEWWFRQNSK